MKSKEVALLVAHPDDETLWTFGTILDRLDRNCIVISLCRENDTDRTRGHATFEWSMHNTGLNPKWAIGFSIGVETARKSNHLENKALYQNGEVINCRQATDYEVFLGWNGIGNV